MRIERSHLIQFTKYAVYAMLFVNGIQYFFEGVNSADFVFDNNLSGYDVLLAYSSVIDTAAWLILLLIFEFETYILEDDVLEGPLWWGLNLLVLVCYGVIAGAFYAYCARIGWSESFVPYVGPGACDLVGQGLGFVNTLDDYVPLDLENCHLLGSDALFSAELNMFATPANLGNLNWMGWVDVVNAGVWLIVILLIQLEVFFESSRLFGTRFFTYYKVSKTLWYLILFACAFIWWRLGGFLEAWDALLWLFAFFFIELNIFNWQEELAHERVESR